MRPLRRLWGRDTKQASRAGGVDIRSPKPSPSPLPSSQTRSPDHLEKKESGIQVSVWREVLNLGGEVEERMNHFPGRPPNRDPLGCSSRSCHGPRASRLARTHFRVCTRTPPSLAAHWARDSRGHWRLDRTPAH
ncbi:hypothetical protein P7K49_034399 [Saguinus oedipus]|uniref:Uncharacterized protein n=1 Tax=Saguinus oedipus TaxID=9490 RepID=A0ABQ9TWE5_SAGOE|nr:hypothetical protein P7K49_034399 [Saguinus oedipus]